MYRATSGTLDRLTDEHHKQESFVCEVQRFLAEYRINQ